VGQSKEGKSRGRKRQGWKIESVVTKAYQYDGTSGGDAHQMGDYCCVYVKARISSSQKSPASAKSLQMLVKKTPQVWRWEVPCSIELQVDGCKDYVPCVGTRLQDGEIC